MQELSPLNISRNNKSWATAWLVVGSFLAAQVLFVLLAGVLQPWDAQSLDRLFALRSSIRMLKPAYDNTIVHVDLNNTTIQQFNNFYLDRSHYAKVVRNLGLMKTAVQAYDIIFADHSQPEHDQALIQASREAGNVYFGAAFALSMQSFEGRGFHVEAALDYLKEHGWRLGGNANDSGFYQAWNPIITFPALAGASKGLGFLSLKADPDGVIRRVPLLAIWNGHFYPSLPFIAVCDYLRVPPERVIVQPGESITLKGAERPGGKPKDIRIPIDAHGNMVINFIGPWERMNHYNFADIYHASDDQEDLTLWTEELSGKIVIVSDVATGSTDIGPVPTDVNFPLSGLHANVIHTILTESFLREFSDLEMLLIEVILAGIVLVLSLRLSSIYFLSGTVILTLGYLGATALSFFVFSIMLQVVRPVLFLGLVTVTVTAFRYFREEKEKEGLRRTFEAYFPPAVVERLILSPDLQSLRGRKKELTILFSDIEDFTLHSATLPPDRIQTLLSEYFEAMVEIVFQFHGTVDKYIGDGLMVFFGDFEPQPDHARRCIQAAIEMQRKVVELDRKWQREGGIPLRIRIGINTGIVAVGNMGSARRLSYTVIGAAVNLSKRLESIAPPGGILISRPTYELVRNEISACSLGPITLKGVEAPVEVFEVVFHTEPSLESHSPGES